MDKDFSKKNCLTDNERYADLINGLLLDGQQHVSATDLQDMDTPGLGIRTLFARYRGGYRQLYRDLVKKVGMGVNFVVFGVENQEMVHYLMPMRSMSYDAAEYDRQARRLRKKVRRMQRLSKAEYLSGFRREDRLLPCITIVLYYGENWDGARSLHEVLDFTDISPRLREYINDYPIHVFEIRKLENTAVFQTDLKQIFEFIKCSSDKQKLRQLVQSDPAYLEMDEDAYDMAVQYTDATQLIAVKDDYVKEGKVNMCRALTEMLADERQEGFEDGIQQATVQSIEFFVMEYLEDGISSERIAEKLMRGFSMTKEQAEETVERYRK